MRKIVCIVLLMLVAFSTVTSAVPSTNPSDDVFTAPEPSATDKVKSVPSTIVLNPSEKTVDIGDVFTVVLYVTVVGEVDTVAVDRITWDTNVLNCTGIVQGDLFPTTLIWLQGKATEDGLKDSVMADNTPISNTSGTYSTLSFKVKGSGDTTITVHGFGVARAGLPLNTSISGGCHVIVNSSSNYQPNETNTNKETPLSLYFALIATIVVLLAVSIFVRKRQKRKEKKEKETEDSSDEDIFN